MRRGRIFIYLALILILGVVAVGALYFRNLLPNANQPQVQVQPTPVVDLVDVVVVTQRVPRGNVFDESVLTMAPIQRDLFIQGYFTDVSEVVGRRARVDLEANMLLTSGMVADTTDQLSTTGSNAALLIPKGMVAVSIPISRLSSVSYAPESGDHVNVIVTMLMMDLDTQYQASLPNYSSAVIGPGPGVLVGSSLAGSAQVSQSEGSTDTTSTSTTTEQNASLQLGEQLSKLTPQNVSGGWSSAMGRAEVDPILGQTYYVVPSEPQRPRLVSQNLLQDAIVLGVGTFEKDVEVEQATAEAQATQTAAEAGQGNEQVQVAETKPPAPDIITLIVTPQDAITLNYLIYAGAELTLALRSSGDDTRIQTEATTLDFLLKQYNIAVPVKLPYGAEPRVDELVAPVLVNDKIATPEP